MNGYISRKDAVEWFMAFIHMDENAISADTVVTDLKYAIPAADVEPVRHGTWGGKTLSTFMDMVCKCGGKEFFTEEHGNQTGLYCSACGKWQKWLKKDEIRLFNHGVKVENASLLEHLKARVAESAIKVSTVKAPHTYMKAVGTRELEKILEEEFKHE